MKKSVFTLAFFALAVAGSVSAHPAFNPFRHMGGHKTVAVAVANSEKTFATAHPGKTFALEKTLALEGGRKTLSTAHPGKTVAMERWTQDHLRSIHK